MVKVYLSCISLVVILFLTLNFPTVIEGRYKLPWQTEPFKLRNVPDYRGIQWCITGKDEPELHGWPFNQFIPLLRRTHRFINDEKNFRYDLRFYEVKTNIKDVGRDGVLFKTVHVSFKAEKKRSYKVGIPEKWEPLPLEGVLIQANHNPLTMGLPTGQFFEPKSDEFSCIDCHKRFYTKNIPCRKRPVISVEHPTVLGFHYLMPYGNGSLQDNIEVGKQDEIHANFRWYSTPCAETRRFQFFIMAVRSFTNHEYDLLKSYPLAVTIRDQKYQSDNFPSPYYPPFIDSVACHARSSDEIMLPNSVPRKFYDFEMSSKFDCCLKYEQNPKSEYTNSAINHYEKSYSCNASAGSRQISNTIEKGEESNICYFPSSPKICTTFDTETADFDYIPCPPCGTIPTTTAPPKTTTPFSIYKRTLHGGIMIMTNFCLQPIVIYIARFYKETFNLHTYKGVKLWYWMHLIGGMISSGMIYFGYFSGAVTTNGYDHVVIGNVYIMTLAFCYLTSWGRHKNSWINTCAEFFHGCLGYVTISLAMACVVTAPGVGPVSKLLVYFMLATQGIFMLILTFHICSLDRKFGMIPRRRHFPTVEARFDEVEVPGGKFRINMLIVFSCITFILSFSSTFFQ